MKRKRHLTKKAKIILFSMLTLILIIGIVVLVIIFSKDKKDNTPIPDNPEVPVVEEKKLNIINEDSNSRPIAVMINNIGVARKYQTGLQDAYMVYEMIVEGGLTRLMAVYKDANTAKIGSIRSARHYYLDYALESDAIYVHFGYSEYAQNDIAKLGVNNLNGLIYDNVYFWRDKSLKVSSEHTAYSSIELINQGITKLGYRTTTNVKPLLSYSVDALDLSSVPGVIPATSVDITYSKSMKTSYTYDEESKSYLRSVNGEAHTDFVTEKQNTAKNIITYQVQNRTISGDIKGRQDLSTIGSGEGYYITEGVAVPITWSKDSRSAKTIYKLKDGTELKVNDGNTYIQIQPKGQTLTIS